MAKELFHLQTWKKNSSMDISMNLHKNGSLTAILKSYYSCENVFKGYYTLWVAFTHWEQVHNWHCRTIIGINISTSHKIKSVGIKPSQISRVLAETTNILLSFVNDSFCFSGVRCIGSHSEHFFNYLYLPKFYELYSEMTEKQTGKEKHYIKILNSWIIIEVEKCFFLILAR